MHQKTMDTHSTMYIRLLLSERMAICPFRIWWSAPTVLLYSSQHETVSSNGTAAAPRTWIGITSTKIFQHFFPMIIILLSEIQAAPTTCISATTVTRPCTEDPFSE